MAIAGIEGRIRNDATNATVGFAPSMRDASAYYPPMPRRIVVFCALAVAASVLFITLGLWQLRRLAERRAFNELTTKQRLNRPIPFRELPRDTAAAHYRGASVDGRFDY